MKELSKELKELKSGYFVNPARVNEGKVTELKAAIEVARERLEDQNITQKEEIKKLLKEQKTRLTKYTDAMQIQTTDINKCNRTIEECKKDINLLKVRHLDYK